MANGKILHVFEHPSLHPEVTSIGSDPVHVVYDADEYDFWCVNANTGDLEIGLSTQEYYEGSREWITVRRPHTVIKSSFWSKAYEEVLPVEPEMDEALKEQLREDWEVEQADLEDLAAMDDTDAPETESAIPSVYDVERDDDEPYDPDVHSFPDEPDDDTDNRPLPDETQQIPAVATPEPNDGKTINESDVRARFRAEPAGKVTPPEPPISTDATAPLLDLQTTYLDLKVPGLRASGNWRNLDR